jgi:predicted GNAT family N-acyltransferase
VKNDPKIHVRIAETREDRDRCMEIRLVVFVHEQKVPPEEEVDNLEDLCTHFIAEGDDQTALGTARLYITPDGQAKAQRVAVHKDARGLGVGAELMRFLEEEALSRGHGEVILGAQTQAIPFYERIGYTCYGAEFMDAGIPHRWMKKKI